MLIWLLVLLIIFWLLGSFRGPIDIAQITLFLLNGHRITLGDLFTFIIVVWLIGILPNPFRGIAFVLLLLWLLSLLGFLALGSSFSSIIILTIILGVIFFLFKSK